MLLGKRTRKLVAATLLTIFATDTFAPGISYALTSGPTQPEATSFEPVDTTDMVNLQTGDLTYNIPLLEVPGPEGGYPLSLSYHAGIQTNEDASWVGLGWTLNPGAISRSVNGYPDDWYTPATSRRDFWQGGSTKTYNIGISVGIAETPATVNFGLSFSQDTYRGFGVGFELGAGETIGGKNSPFSASIGIGISPYGDTYVSGGIGATVFGKGGGFNGSVGLGFSTNFQSFNAGISGGVGYSSKQTVNKQRMSGSLLGLSINTGGDKPSLQLGGLTSSISNSNAGKISTSSHGWHIDIPIYYGINLSLGYSKTRYWSDESASVNTHGSLFPNGWGGTGNSWGGIPDDGAYDEYALLEDPAYKNMIDNPDPTKLQGGAFPDFDVYSVNAQGLGGNIRPYLLEGGIVGQNINSGSTPQVTYCSPGVTDAQPYFRFENDFSNSFRQNYTFYSDPTLNLRLVTPPFDPTPVYGFHDNNGNNDGNTGYNGGNSLAGSKSVNTTLQIKPRNARGYDRNERLFDSHMIEGYTITNESGVNYHFGLPAYSFGEENYQEKLNNKTPLTFTRLSRSSPYAYTWYLTTITGPDYVDRNGNGIADDGDWGYWIDFEYGKQSDDYVWRNPSEGYQRDEDNQFENCSMGHKEVYYLNAVRTRSHVALFEKQLRLDAKGGSQAVFSKNANNSDYANNGSFDGTSAQSLQLSKIYLLNASDENMVGTAAGSSPNTLDKEDVDVTGRAALEAKAIRVLDFNYDYSLCVGTSNSFDFSIPSSKTGKLTLTSVSTRGKGGSNIMPVTSFAYNLKGSDANAQPGVSLALSAGSFSTTNGNFLIGDMIAASGTPDFYCGVITAKTVSGSTFNYTLKNGNYTGGAITATVYKTKNPSYNKDAFDQWGMYKSDFDITKISSNENFGRQTSQVSKYGVDAWSLRAVTSGLGEVIKLNYESDEYKSVLNDNGSFVVQTAGTDAYNAGSLTKVLFSADDDFNYVYNNLHVGDKVNFVAMYSVESVALEETLNDVVDSRTIFSGVHIISFNPSEKSITTDASYKTVIDNEGGDQMYTGPSEAANLLIGKGVFRPGGGIRVNQISAVEGDGSQSTIIYNYQNPNSNQESGVTSYEPDVLDTYNLPGGLQPAEINAYKSALYKDVNSLLAISREVPAPGVMYEYATVSRQVKNADEPAPRDIEGALMYQFEVFRSNMVGRVDIPGTSTYTTTTGRTQAVNAWGTFTTHNLALMKFTNSIGNIRRIVQYDKNTSGRRALSETINHYLHDGLENLPLYNFMTQYKARLAQYYYQGYVQERYSEVKVVNEQGWTPNSKVMSTLSTREEYPCINTGQTIFNYVNGTQASSQNLGYDFYSAAVTQTLDTDPYNNSFMTQKIPAYQKYPAMGLKVTTGSNLNMLTQTAESYIWKVDANNNNNKLGLISASATTWSNLVPAIGVDGTVYTQNSFANGNVWRPQYTYSWMPAIQTSDGITPYASFADFNWGTPSSSDGRWVKTSETTLYDVYSKALEITDINASYASTHMNYGENRVTLIGGPAKYYEIAYSGAEDAGVNQTSASFIQAADGVVSSAAGAAHTGTQSLLLNPGKKGFLYTAATANLTPGRNYTASVWVKPVSGTASDVKLYYDISGAVKAPSASSSLNMKTAGGWTLINLAINGTDITTGATLHVWCQNDHATAQAYVDDMRFRPLDAGTTAYVYDPFSGELTHMLDNNNLYTRFQYDAMGRLVKTYQEKLNIGEFKTNQWAYNFKAPQFTSDAVNLTYTKNNCPLYTAGTNVTVIFPAGAYTSFISKPDANNTANVYAQDYANVHGSCSCAPQFAFASGISPIVVQLPISGTRVNFTFVFSWPSGSTSFNLGTISGGCALPTAVRTVPVTVGSTVYNVIVNPSGAIQVQLISGTAPTGAIGLTGIYDLLANLFYSAGQSGSFQKTNCTSGVGNFVPYSVPADKYAATDQTTANNLAVTDLNTNGPINANSSSLGTCSIPCSFTWSSGITSRFSANISSAGTTGSFNIVFGSPGTNYIGGSLGTITGGCFPSSTRTVTVTDGATTTRTWNVTITNTGAVSISLGSGSAATSSGPPIIIGGAYNL